MDVEIAIADESTDFFFLPIQSFLNRLAEYRMMNKEEEEEEQFLSTQLVEGPGLVFCFFFFCF
jgi:hypothetical protein